VFATLINVVTPGLALAGTPEFVQIRVVNHGRDAVVAGIGWWRLRGFMKTKNWLQLQPNDHYSTKLPKRLQFGEEAVILFPTDTFNRDAKSLLTDINRSYFPKLRVRLLRVGVFTSTGEHFRVSLEPYMRAFLLERAREVSRQPA
jgi:hypothetical protein